MLRMLIAGIFYWLWLVCPSAGLAFTLPSGGRLHSRILKKEPLSVPATLLWKPRSSTLLRLGGEVEFKARSDNVDKKQRISAFVESMGGKRTIQRILVASNGMAATKAILSMREWAYKTFGQDRLFEFVVMATREDLNANAEFIRLADAIVEVPSGPNKNNYANVDLIVDIAKEEGVDAVWPGWGHASENPNLPMKLKDCGIQFIGPTGSVMAALGDKISANILAQTAKVPSIPWSGNGIEAHLNEDGLLPKAIFDQACIFSLDQALATANKIGYPVMIKASEGGGGKGIRLAANEENLKSGYTQVANEVPGSPIFIMRQCQKARHLEVQIIGDEYGNAIALNGRDCSIQRRFQKIFEEGPPTVTPRETFREMEKAAQRLTQAIGYTGAGTVEYLYNQEENKYYFLELNPRLQVEHPVTEGITGINLPALQLQIAMGIPLYCVPEIRTFYDENPAECTPIDFLRKEYRYPSSHVIAARITAENPDEGFKPTSGKIDRVEFQSSSNVWAYFSVANNGGIHEYADSQFGHVFAKGSTREEARKSLILALKSIDVRGEIRTTVEYLIKLLETKEFINNRIDTSWLDGIIHQKSMIVTRDPEKVALSAAIFKTHSRICTQFKTCEEILSKGQASLLEIDSLLSFDLDLTIDGVLYHFIVTNLGKNYYRLKINEQVIDTQVRQQPDGSLLCDVHGEKIQLYGQEESLGLKMKVDGETVLIPNVFNPSELRSDVTGKVVRFLQNDHDIVMKNEAYVEVEAMKMILTLKASETGRIHHQMAAGSIVAAGDLLATLALRDKAAVKPVFPFQGKIRFVPERNPPNLETTISLALKGYNHEDIEHSISTYFEVAKLQDIELFLSEQILQFVKIETPFDSWDESLAISRLLVSQKEEEVLLSIVAHKQIKQRMDIMLALLRQLEFLPQKYPEYDLRESCMDKKLLKAIETLANLKSTRFGIITLKAKEILDCASTPPFGQRLNSLRATLMSPAVDLDTLSRLPDMSVSIDLLTILMNDVESIVRRAAAETYIRRVYRAHIIHDVFIEEGRSSDGQIMTIQWNFSYRNMTGQEITPPIRQGYMEMHAEVINFETVMQGVMERSKTFLIKHPNYADSLNVLHVGFSKLPEQLLFEDEDKLGVMLFSTISRFKSELSMMGCRSLSFLTKSRFISNNENDFRLSHYNFLAENNFQENRVSRNMRPTLPQLLELNRMTKNYEVLRLPTIGRNAFLFLGREKQSDQNSKDVAQEVLFLRSISHSNESISLLGADRIISMALEELERAHLDPRVSSASSSRLFVYVIPENALNTEDCIVQFESIMDILIAKYATRLLKLRVDEIEVKLRVVDQNNPSLLTPIRLIASSSTGGWLTREAYRETIDPITGNTNQYCTFSGEQICILDPYPTSSTLQKKRATARRVGTTYAPDFLGLIEIALINSWQSYLNSIGKVQVSPPSNVLSFEELVLDNGKLIPMKRFPGNNRIGMLAWRSTWKTPHYPQGRDVVIIANDVTIQSGSFGVKEDEFFFKASEYARERGLPRIFISCNSGARIGLVEEMKQKIKVGWKDESNPISGFDYLYLSEDDFLSLPKGTVEATAITTSSGELRYQLSAVIGLAYGIGVENLKGSGLIAGETSRAYEESFTLSYVTGRSVGIGAYLNRLGQRVIQMRVGPMILTGFSALNKLLGREVYTSQDQLGGPQIMYSNGVSHQVVNDDPEGMQAVVDWISFVPEKFNVIAPKLAEVDALFDSPSRTIDFKPSKAPYDPRHMLAGVTSPDGRYLSGFFDKGSFKEYLGGWGKSVVVGRARLGGINVGTIAVETRLSEQRIPADPGNPQSRENVVMQAGQVWYPDSAYKTAQAIRDFNRGENLPLIIFANWRGFSGGTRDMFSEVLKFGAMIVDALREYKHPVFVYIPPEAELRGGAWVVIDPSINPDHMEMFADKNARGGILEPPGICEVKFRTQEQNLAMQRLDPILQDLYEAVGSAITVDEKAKLNMEIKTREKLLAPLYLQIAHEFADLHDRAGRMKAKDCIVDILNWENSREFFYWRILLKQKFQKVCNYLRSDTGDSFSYMELTEKINDIIPAEISSDQDKFQWLETHQEVFKTIKQEIQAESRKSTLKALLKGLSEKERNELFLVASEEEIV